MPSDNAAAEWISRNSVVFTVFKNCQKLSQSFFSRKKGREFIITDPGTKYSSSPADCGGQEVTELSNLFQIKGDKLNIFRNIFSNF